MNLITARFTKRFTKGHLKGISLRESMPFVSVKAAETWYKFMQKATALSYIIEDFYIENPIHTQK